MIGNLAKAWAWSKTRQSPNTRNIEVEEVEKQFVEYDVVALIEDLPEEKLVKGAVGTIVNYLAPGVFLVEFCDKGGITLALPVIREDQISLVARYNPRIKSDL